MAVTREPRAAANASPLRGAVDGRRPSGGGEESARERAWAAAASVVDPEIPVLTIADLGVLRDVKVENGAVEVIITPTYSGCPAMNVIALELELALEQAGFAQSRITTVRSPAWTTDWMTRGGQGEAARLRHRAAGARPGAARCSARSASPARAAASDRTERISEFGSTACKALWRCRACAEPFDYFKCI